MFSADSAITNNAFSTLNRKMSTDGGRRNKREGFCWVLPKEADTQTAAPVRPHGWLKQPVNLVWDEILHWMKSFMGWTTNRLQIAAVETTSPPKTTKRNKLNSSGKKLATATTNASLNVLISKCISSNTHRQKTLISMIISLSWTLILIDFHLDKLSSLLTIILLCKHAHIHAE